MKFPRALRSAMAESSKLLEHRGKIRQAIRKAGQDRQAFAANMTDVQQRLASEEAEQALSDDSSAAPGPARKALSAARDQEQVIEARIVGLEAKLAESDEGLLAAHRIFSSVYGEFCEVRLGEIEAEWDQMLSEQIVPFLRRSIAEIEGLGRLATGARKAEFRCVASIETKFLQIVPQRGQGSSDIREVLLEDRVFGKIHAEASEVGRLQDKLVKEITAIQKAAEARKVAEAEAQFEYQRKHGGILPSGRTTYADPPPKNEIYQGSVGVLYKGGVPQGPPDASHYQQTIKLHEEGLSIKEIAAKLERYENTIREWLETAALEKEREKEREKALYEQTIALHEKGLSVREIARKLDYFEATIIQVLKTAEQEKEQEKATAEAEAN